MRTAYLEKLNEKMIDVLSLINRSQGRLKDAEFYLKRSRMTCARNELSLWPCGMPHPSKLEHDEAIARAVNIRLKKYYITLAKKHMAAALADPIPDELPG
jgi:hypothetical protein